MLIINRGILWTRELCFRTDSINEGENGMDDDGTVYVMIFVSLFLAFFMGIFLIDIISDRLWRVPTEKELKKIAELQRKIVEEGDFRA